MLRAVKGGEGHVGGLGKEVDGGDEVAVHPGGVGDEPYPFPFQNVEIALLEHIHSGLHSGVAAGGDDEENESEESLYLSHNQFIFFKSVFG